MGTLLHAASQLFYGASVEEDWKVPDVEVITVPLLAVLEDAPRPEAVIEFWHSLTAATPEHFGDGLMQERQRALRRAREGIRDFPRVASPRVSSEGTIQVAG